MYIHIHTHMTYIYIHIHTYLVNATASKENFSSGKETKRLVHEDHAQSVGTRVGHHGHLCRQGRCSAFLAGEVYHHDNHFGIHSRKKFDFPKRSGIMKVQTYTRVGTRSMPNMLYLVSSVQDYANGLFPQAQLGVFVLDPGGIGCESPLTTSATQDAKCDRPKPTRNKLRSWALGALVGAPESKRGDAWTPFLLSCRTTPGNHWPGGRRILGAPCRSQKNSGVKIWAVSEV